MHHLERDKLVALLKEAGEVYKHVARKAKLLSALSWESQTAADFFKNKEAVLPKPQYPIDRKALLECVKALTALAPKLRGEHPVYQWLMRLQESYLWGCLLLLETEKKTFFEIASQLYGNSESKLFNLPSTNLEFARALAGRISAADEWDLSETPKAYSAEEFGKQVEERLAVRIPHLAVRVEVTSDIVAKAVAGMSRVRIRKDAKFSRIELDALWNHEIESHCLTAQNGSHQSICDFMMGGGARSTMTQEGLAVFYEVYGHTMSQRRFMVLCDRVEAVHKAEQGADFIEIYRWFKGRMETPMDAFYSAQRVFRGAPLTGGAPFTKDAVYLGGLIGVYNFLRLAVKNQNRLLIETLVCGRLSLEDVGTVAWLRSHGVVDPPKFVPLWLKNWEALISFFSLAAVLGSVDLSGFQGYFDEYTSLADWDLS